MFIWENITRTHDGTAKNAFCIHSCRSNTCGSGCRRVESNNSALDILDQDIFLLGLSHVNSCWW